MSNARESTARLADLLRRERSAMADFLVALADFDGQRLWLELGYSSLFDFLHRELGLSKGAAHYRKVAAELVQNFPEIVEPLRAGLLCITTIVSLAKVLTPENRNEMLPRFFHRSRREAMEIVAELRPAEAPPMRVVVTPLPAPAANAGIGPEPTSLGSPPRENAVAVQLAQLPDAKFEIPLGLSTTPAESSTPPAPPQRDAAEPLTGALSRLHVTVSRCFLEKLEAARSALSHARPGATAEDVLEAGLELLLERQAKRNGLVEKPRKDPPPSKPDHIPAHVKRAVWKCDRSCCSWPVEGGGVCGSTLRLQFDHIKPRALGGPSTVDNIRLACAVHNGYAARRVFGDRWMDRFTRKRERNGAVDHTARQRAEVGYTVRSGG